MALNCHQVLEADIKKGGDVPDYQPVDCRLQTDHISLVDTDARHPLSGAQLRHEPLDPEPEVDDDGDVEEGEEEPEHVELVRVALIQEAAATARALEKTNTSGHRLGGEGSLNDGGPWEDGVHDEEE